MRSPARTGRTRPFWVSGERGVRAVPPGDVELGAERLSRLLAAGADRDDLAVVQQLQVGSEQIRDDAAEGRPLAEAFKRTARVTRS